ncbi:MAG: hypothetical protein KKA16_09020 [Alphaproteobacteria bacterium]|nr:hypothetical protein [Alphaproteobacteria bacterium]MBU1539888.1 hypothetical protein [Alphaproteobacteria bacterium]MBU2378580.1 hypothetical protein [Alphaproteobacteria bacterium]
MTVRIFAAAAALAFASLAASAAAAQQTPPAQPMAPQGVPIQRPGAFEQQSQFEASAWQNSLSQQAATITSPARMSRAERLAALINDGKCAEAHTIAVDEGDTRLARRISQLCSLDN